MTIESAHFKQAVKCRPLIVTPLNDMRNTQLRGATADRRRTAAGNQGYLDALLDQKPQAQPVPDVEDLVAVAMGVGGIIGMRRPVTPSRWQSKCLTGGRAPSGVSLRPRRF